MLIEWIKSNWLSVLITCIFIPFLGFLIKYYWNNYISVIKISPSIKKINCSSASFRKESYYVYLTNRSQNPIYDIHVLVTHPKEVQVRVTPEEEENQLLGSFKVGTSFIIHFDSVENKNTSGQQTVINNLGANRTAKLKVEIDKDNCFKNFKLKLRVSYNSREPKPILCN
ncbi:MAG: hypothetical protein Q7S42_03225 [Candidatus Omnitrophota bacterium]|nr:hypothetical protein [Candidatus Omnitrophota bacterium]